MSQFVDQLKIPFFTIFFIFAFLYLFAKLLGPLPLQITSITTTKTDLFSVNGVGEVKATATKVRFSLGVTKTAATSDQAKNEVNKIINQIILNLQKLGIDKKYIKTNNLSVYPNYDNTLLAGRAGTISGYTATVNLDIFADSIEKANQAIDNATLNGANLISGIQFDFDEQTRKKLEEEAMKKAIDNAKDKAEQIAKIAGIKLGKIVNLTINNEQMPILFDAKAGSASQETTNLQPGENTIRISVSLSYETL